jgi:hypothetical protein
VTRLGSMIVYSALAGSAALTAYLIGHVAHDDIGLTRPAIRHFALAATAVIAALLVVRSFRRS